MRLPFLMLHAIQPVRGSVLSSRTRKIWEACHETAFAPFHTQAPVRNGEWETVIKKMLNYKSPDYPPGNLVGLSTSSGRPSGSPSRKNLCPYVD